MAQRLAAHDWSATPLGPVDSWSPCLRTAVAMVLRSRYPMLLSWGEHLVMLYNDAFIPTLGTKHPGATGGLLPEQFAEVWGDIGAMQRAVLAGGAATWDEDLRLTIERGAGPEEFFFTFSYSHVPDERGPGGVLAVLTVTTDKVVAARRLSLLNQLAVVAADQATDPVEAMDAVLSVLARAEHDLVGGALYRAADQDTEPTRLSRAGMFGELDTDRLPQVVDHLEHPVNQARLSQAPVIATDCVALPVRGPDGEDAILVLLPHPLRPVDVDHERFLGLVGDQVGQILSVATARAREHARLEALATLDAAKTAFLSNVSHEFRTPLTLLLGPLEDVLEGREPAIDRAGAEVMHHSAHRLLRLVNALLDVARIEADGLTAEPEPTDVAQLTRDLLQPFVDAAARAGLELVIEVDPHLGFVMADPSLWEKIVLNLVANAIKYTPSGAVTISLSAREERVVLRVTDTGLGIPADQIGKVFDRFHRVHENASRNIEGTGIGLTLVAEAAKAMGGSVSAESEPGSGSSFTVSLPLLRSTGAVRASWAPSVKMAEAFANEVSPLEPVGSGAWESAQPEGTSGPVVLVVEDNPALRARVARLLSSIGTVIPVADGLAALERLKTEHVDLVVTDVMMPGLDGLGLLASIRGDAALRSTPVILLSARAGSEAAAGAIDAGADDYVIKPFTPGELLARCRMSIELADYRARSAASHVRGAMMAGVSHDMQTPLAVITTALGLLAEPDVDERQRGHIAARAQVRASQLTRLVAQFLDWSRLSTSQPLPVRMELVDLAQVVVQVASEHVGIRVTGDAESGSIWCDRQRTQQILHNLVDNAQRATRTGIEIRLDADEDALAVRVADDGGGIPPDVLPSLFEAFGPTTASRGNGLGLHVSREAARAQGGTLVLESTGSEGTVFALRLPRQRS